MKRLLPLLGAAMMMLNLVGCAQEKTADGGSSSTVLAPTVDCARSSCDTNGDGIPDAPGGSGSASNGSGGYYSGSTAALTNVQGLGTMFFNSYPNDPKNIQINVNLNRTLDGVIVSYTDNGKVVEAGLGTRFPNGNRENNQYNGWVTEGSARVYKGFFQDKYGAVVLVIDKVLNAGDGTAAPYVGGSIYFQNFGDNPAYDSPCQSGDPDYGTCFVSQLMCWEIKAGPYDCRSFLQSGKVVMNSMLNPTGSRGPTRTKSYQKLGDFTGLSRVEANLPNP